MATVFAVLGVGAASARESSASAVDALAAHPDVLADSSPAQLGDQSVAPSLTATGSGIDAGFSVVDSGAGALLPADAHAAMQLYTRWGPLYIQPVNLTPDAGSGVPVGDDAVVYQGTSHNADTIVRATPLGLATFTQIRGASAPRSYSWRLYLPGGIHLKTLDDGSVAVLADTTVMTESRADAVDDALAATEQPATATIPSDDHTSDPTDAPDPVAANDSLAALDSATSGLRDAAQQTDGFLLAHVPLPTATDASGARVATSLSVEGSVITMHVDLSGPRISYPVLAIRTTTTASA